MYLKKIKMKILCFFGRHKWEYENKKFTIVYSHPKIAPNFAAQKNNIDGIDLPVRICKRCMKKQRQYSYMTLHDKIHTWKDCELSREENREKSLRKILGEDD